MGIMYVIWVMVTLKTRLHHYTIYLRNSCICTVGIFTKKKKKKASFITSLHFDFSQFKFDLSPLGVWFWEEI